MARCFRRQRRRGFSRNTRNTSKVWSSAATTRSLYRVLCCRLLNCCGSLSVHARGEPISIERSCRTTISARLLLSTRIVEGFILSIRPLRRQRYAVVTMGSEATAVDRNDAVPSRLEPYFDAPKTESVFRDMRGAFKRGPAAAISEAFFSRLAPARV